MAALTPIEVRISAVELAEMRYPESMIHTRLLEAGIPVLNTSCDVSAGVLHRRNLLKENAIVYRWIPKIDPPP